MRKESGVTLIAAIIAIVIFIVLAVVSFGSPKAIEKPMKMATRSKTENLIAQDKEQISLAFSEFVHFGEFGPEDIKEKLEGFNKGSVIQVELIGEEDFSINIDGRKYEVNVKAGGEPVPIN
jgi:hypothetical protein